MRRWMVLLPISIFGAILASRVPLGAAQTPEHLRRAAISAFEDGDFARAQQLFSRLVKQDPSAANFNYLAMAERSAGNIKQAIIDFRRSIQLGNASAIVHYNLGLAYLQDRQVELGIRELRRAIARDPRLKAARYNLAVALLDAGRASEAIPYLNEARKESPCAPEIWANLVRAEFEAGDANAAVHAADEAVRATPNDVRLIVTLADVCYRHHETQKARHLLEGATELMPDDPDVKLLIVKVSLQVGEPIEALAVLKDVPADRGSPGELQFMRGLALALLGNLMGATGELSTAVHADPHNVEYSIAYAWLYQLEGRHDQALLALNKAQELDPQMPMIPYRKAVSYFFLRQYPQTADSCQEAIRLDPHYDPAYLLLGIAKLEQGDFNAAQAALRKAVILQPGTALFHRELGVALFKGGSLTGSKKELDEALTIDPESAQAYFWRAQVLASQGNRRKAIADLETAIALQPHYANAYSELAQLYSADGQLQKAAAILAKRKELKGPISPDDRDRFLTDPLL